MALARRAADWLAAAGLAWCCAAGGVTQEAASAQMLVAAEATPPPASRPWQAVPLPDLWRKSRPSRRPEATWYRVEFTHPDDPDGQPWAVFLPFLYDGGSVWLNGALVDRIPENTPQQHVRWARPHLVPLPPALLRAGSNELAVRAAQPPPGASLRMPRMRIGPEHELSVEYDRRFFWVGITPRITATVCLLVALCVLFIWWRRRSEVLYGLFGVAVALWGIRTMTFVVEVVPMPAYPLWRLAFHAATGGFIVAMTLLAFRLAGRRKRGVERALVLYWMVGPLWLLAGGADAEPLVNRFWTAGFLPIGAAIMVISVRALWRQRTLEAAVLPVTMVLAVLAGMHDYLIAWELDPRLPLLAQWASRRIYLLHHAANLMLVSMGGLLTARFLDTLRSEEELRHGLQARVADREKELAGNYVRLFALERDNAAALERQRILREIHDGVGSQLFVSLSRVERGEMERDEIAGALRACIADLRLALDTLSPQERDFRSALGNFLFRWQRQLQACGVRLDWAIEVPDQALALSQHAALQLLRVAQEALTNTLKHAGASAVHVRLAQADGQIALEVRDDGAGLVQDSVRPGRGLANMRARAAQLGGALDIGADSTGTRVTMRVPLNTVRA